MRAQLIDKDRQPKWQPAKLADVTDAMVERYFKGAAASPAFSAVGLTSGAALRAAADDDFEQLRMPGYLMPRL